MCPLLLLLLLVSVAPQASKLSGVCWDAAMPLWESVGVRPRSDQRLTNCEASATAVSAVRRVRQSLPPEGAPVHKTNPLLCHFKDKLRNVGDALQITKKCKLGTGETRNQTIQATSHGSHCRLRPSPVADHLASACKAACLSWLQRVITMPDQKSALHPPSAKLLLEVLEAVRSVVFLRESSLQTVCF
jgi:hypothetical protein